MTEISLIYKATINGRAHHKKRDEKNIDVDNKKVHNEHNLINSKECTVEDVYNPIECPKQRRRPLAVDPSLEKERTYCRKSESCEHPGN